MIIVFKFLLEQSSFSTTLLAVTYYNLHNMIKCVYNNIFDYLIGN